MRYYFAPMEGVTDSIYREVHHQYFGGVDRYYMPFLSPTMHRTLTHKESRELPMADSVPFVAVPQILTKVADDFLWAAQVCADRGYEEVNLNVGCPSGTVVSKGKGSGMLRDVNALDAFLEEIFTKSPLPVSVKTRLGVESPDEFPAILEVYNRYPIRELTIHPRTRKEFYSGNIHGELFAYAVENSQNSLCFNGNLCNLEDISTFFTHFSTVDAVMIGRGLIGDPGMLSGGTDAATLEKFMEELLERYTEAFGGARNAMFRMKENWSFLRYRFANIDRLWKQLRKTTDLNEYKSISKEIFRTLPLTERFDPQW